MANGYQIRDAIGPDALPLKVGSARNIHGAQGSGWSEWTVLAVFAPQGIPISMSYYVSGGVPEGAGAYAGIDAGNYGAPPGRSGYG